MISSLEADQWLDHFVIDTGKIPDPDTVMTDDMLGWPQLKFCVQDALDECYVMMRDIKEVTLMARDIVDETCDYEQDCPEDDLERMKYTDRKVKSEWCKIVSGDDHACEYTVGGEVYWREL